MHSIALAAQLAVAVSVFVVWIFRFDNIARDFERFQYPPIFRNAVGLVKLVSATLLVVGVWSPAVVPGAAAAMAALMVGAQWSHWRVGNPTAQRIPSAVLLLLSAIVLVESLGWLP